MSRANVHSPLMYDPAGHAAEHEAQRMSEVALQGEAKKVPLGQLKLQLRHTRLDDDVQAVSSNVRGGQDDRHDVHWVSVVAVQAADWNVPGVAPHVAQAAHTRSVVVVGGEASN